MEAPKVTLAQLNKEGRRLINGSWNIRDTHRDFRTWVEDVASWLDAVAPNSGLATEWSGLPTSILIFGNRCDDSREALAHFYEVVRKRLQWLSSVPKIVANQQKSAAAPERIQSNAFEIGRREIQFDTKSRAFVDPARVEELRNIKSKTFDFTKLIRLCEELNICFATECYLATAMVTRSVLDHVPPVFDCKSFQEVANNYSGSKSFRESIQHLDKSSRKIADQHLHGQVRQSEVLPTAKQVDFSQDLDVLLAEVVRLSKRDVKQ